MEATATPTAQKLHQQAQYARSEAIGAGRVLRCLAAAGLLSDAGYNHGMAQWAALNAKADALAAQWAELTTTQAA